MELQGHRRKLPAVVALIVILSALLLLATSNSSVTTEPALSPLPSTTACGSLPSAPCTTTTAAKSSSLLTQLALLPPHDVEVLHVRGNVNYSRATLTEGPPGKPWDSAEIFFPVVTPAAWETSPRWIVGYAPYVKKHKCPESSETVEIVHHMNVLSDHAGDDARFVATYDRGAVAYTLPRRASDGRFLYGLPVDKDAPLFLEFHLLTPHCWNWHTAAVVFEDSGFDLYVTSKPPLVANAAMLAWADQDMQVLPGKGVADQVTKISSDDLLKMFRPKVVQWPVGVPSVNLVAVHLHTHDLFRSKYFQITDARGIVKFRSELEVAGYGATEQSMVSTEGKGWPELSIEPGDTMEQHCIVDTDLMANLIVDGTSWGQEMCAFIGVVAGPGISTPATQLSMSHDYGTTAYYSTESARLAAM